MSNQRFKLFITLVILVSLLTGIVAPTYGAATKKVASITDLAGKVSIRKAGGERTFAAFKGISLVQGDTIITGVDGWATLRLDENTEVKIAANSQIMLSELIQSLKDGKDNTSISVLTGGLWVNVKKALNVDSKLEIRTPTAIMGVRGTKFFVFVGEEKTEVNIVEGRVTVTSVRPVEQPDGTIVEEPVVTILEQNQTLTVEERASAVADFLITTLTQETLNVFVLEAISALPVAEQIGISETLLEDITKVIEEKKSEEEKNQVPPAEVGSPGTGQGNIINYGDTPAPPQPKGPMTISHGIVYAGLQANLTLSTTANDDAGKLVRTHFIVPPHIQIEHYNPTTGSWSVLTEEHGVPIYGAQQGFQIANTSTLFRATFPFAGTYDVSVEFRQAGLGNQLVGSRAVTFNIVPPAITVTGFTADGLPMAGNLTDGYTLNTNNEADKEYLVQFAAGTAADETLAAEHFGLYLVESTVSATELQDYYEDRGTPDPYLSYLNASAEGYEPFAYINGATLQLVDGARYVFQDEDTDMAIPGDFPNGTYTVEGQIISLDGVAATVTYKLNVSYQPMEVSYEAPTFIVGQQSEFTVSTVANGDVGKMVRAYFTIPEGVSAEYYEVQDHQWYPLPNDYGPAEGFPVANVTSRFQAIAAEPGTYTATVEFRTVPGGEVLGSIEIALIVNEAPASADFSAAEIAESYGAQWHSNTLTLTSRQFINPGDGGIFTQGVHYDILGLPTGVFAELLWDTEHTAELRLEGVPTEPLTGDREVCLTVRSAAMEGEYSSLSACFTIVDLPPLITLASVPELISDDWIYTKLELHLAYDQFNTDLSHDGDISFGELFEEHYQVEQYDPHGVYSVTTQSGEGEYYYLAADMYRTGPTTADLWLFGSLPAGLGTLEILPSGFVGCGARDDETFRSNTISLRVMQNLDYVEIDVAAGVIYNTLPNMEYYLDGGLSGTGEWLEASGEYEYTSGVTFGPGDVWVREADYPANSRLVATLTVPAAPTLGNLTTYDGSFVTITGVPDRELEYCLNMSGTGEWTTVWTSWKTDGYSEAYINAPSGTQFTWESLVRVRFAATTDALPSESTERMVDVYDQPLY